MADYGNLTKAELVKLLEEERAKRGNRDLNFKVSAKGAVSVYGLNSRFPVTLYAQQWEKLLGQREKVLGFIEKNESKLSRKD